MDDRKVFLANRRARVRNRKLGHHAQLIRELREEGYTFADIAAYLHHALGIKVEPQSVGRHCAAADKRVAAHDGGTSPSSTLPRAGAPAADTGSTPNPALPPTHEALVGHVGAREFEDGFIGSVPAAGETDGAKDLKNTAIFQSEPRANDRYSASAVDAIPNSEGGRTIVPSPTAAQSRKPTAAELLDAMPGIVEITLDDPQKRAEATAYAAELRKKARESRRR